MMVVKKLCKLHPVTRAEYEALLELMPLASDHSMHGDDSAGVALKWMRRMQDAYNVKTEQMK